MAAGYPDRLPGKHHLARHERTGSDRTPPGAPGKTLFALAEQG
jgi:hypothetical protein